MKLDKTSDAPVIGALNIIRKVAGRKLSHFPVISHALTTNALATARFIRTIAHLHIFCFFAFHLTCPFVK